MADDKKKVAILGVLVVGLLAVGAYQFVGSGPAEKKPAKKDTQAQQQESSAQNEVQAAAGQEDPMRHYFALGLKPRNPFQPAALPDTNPNPETETNNRIIHAPPEPKPQPRVSTPYSNQVPPWNPTIPGVTAEGSATTPVTPTNEFSYVLIGIVEGPSPVAVFQTGDGAQKMVRVGEYVGEDTKVVRIQNGSVVLQSNGKTITRRVGGK
jgi:type II secretory pathway pseudopilin PulG